MKKQEAVEKRVAANRIAAKLGIRPAGEAAASALSLHAEAQQYLGAPPEVVETINQLAADELGLDSAAESLGKRLNHAPEN